MGYAGKTHIISFDKGGLVHNQNIDAIPDTAMVHPSRNIDLHKGGRGKRGGTAHVNLAALTGTPQITGLHQFVKQNGNTYRVSATADGKIFSEASEIQDTTLTLNVFSQMTVADDELYICNGADTPRKWTGAGNTVALTLIPADWATVKPKQFVVHGAGNSLRMWALGFASGYVYSSKSGDVDNFSDASAVLIKIRVEDGYGIVGGVEFGDRLICFGKRQAFVIDDTNTDPAYWGYEAAQWSGGVSHHRLIIKTPNDIILMADDGELYSIRTAQEYGDYRQASIMRPAKMQEWFRENANLSRIDQFHGLYDPVFNAVRIWFVRAGQTQVDSCLVYYLDRDPMEAFTVHDNQSYASGYSASCSALFRYSTGIWKVYTGDYSGFIWKLNESNKNDNSNGYYAGFKTPHMALGDPRTNKRFDRAVLVSQPFGGVNYNLQMQWWIDGAVQTAQSLSLSATGATLGTFVLGTDTLGGTGISDKYVYLGGLGKRIQMEFYNSNANEDFFVSTLMLDTKEMGRRPQ